MYPYTRKERVGGRERGKSWPAHGSHAFQCKSARSIYAFFTFLKKTAWRRSLSQSPNACCSLTHSVAAAAARGHEAFPRSAALRALQAESSSGYLPPPPRTFLVFSLSTSFFPRLLFFYSTPPPLRFSHGDRLRFSGLSKGRYAPLRRAVLLAGRQLSLYDA